MRDEADGSENLPSKACLLYEIHRAKAKRLSQTILKNRSADLSSPQIKYFVAQAQILSQICTSRSMPEASLQEGGIAGRVLDFLNENIAGVLHAAIDVDTLLKEMRARLGLLYWNQLMNDSPMGDHAASCAEFLLSNQVLSGSCLELGAGCGNLSKLIHSQPKLFIRTDLSLSLLNKSYGHQNLVYDFDEPGPFLNIDVIISANALHCAKNKTATLGYLFQMLKPGGWIVISEGEKYVRDYEPWALNLIFGLYSGWWDVSGFLTREEWLSAFAAAGFTSVGSSRHLAGPYDLGGLIWARRPT